MNNKLIDYVMYQLTYRKAKKSNRFYRSLVRLYLLNPDMVYEFINNVNELGYYKDLIHILCRSSYKDLNNYIYNRIIEIIRHDLTCLSHNENISTMAKWLPKEHGFSDKKNGFVKIFCKLYFGGASNYHLKQYRLLRTQLNKNIGTLECKMCTKDYNSINFDKIGVNSLVHNMNALSKHPELKDKIVEALSKKNYKLPIFIEKIIKGRIPKSISKKIYDMYNFIDKLPNSGHLKSINRCIINMSNTMFNKKAHCLAIGMCLELKRMNNNIEILSIKGDRLSPVHLENNNLFNNINILLSCCNAAGTVTIPDDKNTLVITDKRIKGNNIIQYIQNDDTNVDIVCANMKQQYNIRQKNKTIKNVFNKYSIIINAIYWMLILVLIINLIYEILINAY